MQLTIYLYIHFLHNVLVNVLEIEFKFLLGETYICPYIFLYYKEAKLLSKIKVLNRTHILEQEMFPEN